MSKTARQIYCSVFADEAGKEGTSFQEESFFFRPVKILSRLFSQSLFPAPTSDVTALTDFSG